MERTIASLIDNIEHCILPKLSKALDDSDNHPELANYNNRLYQYFPRLLISLGEVDLRENKEILTSALSSLLILYKELQCDRPWITEEAKDCAKKLDHFFQLTYDISLGNLLNSTQFNAQSIFDQLLDKLLFKLTVNSWKMYPGLVEAYYSLLEDLQSCKVMVNPVKALPISMLLIEDYVITNKLKGVKSCHFILMKLSPEDFARGNYYEIIYGSLKKMFLERDLELTKLSCDCMLRLLSILPSDVCFTKSNHLYSEVLDQLFTEANLYRKAALFNFTTALIQILQVECVKRRRIMNIFHDNFDSCCTEGVADVLLPSVLQCFEEWLKHCWCVWKLAKNQKILCVLFKVLYVSKDETVTEKIVHTIITIISLCTHEERNKIIKSLNRSVDIKSQEFNQKVELIKNTFF